MEMGQDNPWRAVAERGPATLWTKLNNKGRVMYHATMGDIKVTMGEKGLQCNLIPVPPNPNKFSIYSTPRSAWARYDREQEREDGKEKLRNAQKLNG